MSNKNQSETGLKFTRHFTKDDVTPYEMFEYDYRTSIIKNTSGEVVFQMDNVEVPKQYGENRDWNVDLIPKFVVADGKI